MLRFLTLLSLVILSIRLYMTGVFSPVFITIALVAAVVAMAVGRTGRIVAASIGGLLLLAQFVSGGDTALRGQFIQSVLTLTLVLAGIYIIMRGPLGGANNGNHGKPDVSECCSSEWNHQDRRKHEEPAFDDQQRTMENRVRRNVAIGTKKEEHMERNGSQATMENPACRRIAIGMNEESLNGTTRNQL
jgi:hypothetical protein